MTAEHMQARSVRCSPAVRWVQDAGHITLVNPDTGQSWKLEGTEMVIWDLLQRGYDWQELHRLLCLVEALPPSEAGEMLTRVVKGWLDEGILQTV